MLSNTSIWKTQIFRKFEKVKVWKFSYLKKSAITFAQGCTAHVMNWYGAIIITNDDLIHRRIYTSIEWKRQDYSVFVWSWKLTARYTPCEQVLRPSQMEGYFVVNSAPNGEYTPLNKATNKFCWVEFL